LANCKTTGVFQPSHCRGLLYDAMDDGTDDRMDDEMDGWMDGKSFMMSFNI
jgi:hypothetical protein